MDCHLHFLPTLRERTDGRWLHEGESSTSTFPSAGLSHGPPPVLRQDGTQRENSPIHHETLSSEDPDSPSPQTEDEPSDTVFNAQEDQTNREAKSLKNTEQAIRAKIAALEKKYGTDLST